jgi:hypothetical protein
MLQIFNQTLRQKSYSKKSDVYMFGFVLYELLTRRLASRDNTTEQYFQILRSEYQNVLFFFYSEL